MRSIVTRIRAEDEARLQDVIWCPTQFQRRIGGFEVPIGGDAALTGSRKWYIVPDRTDPFDLPAEIAALCRKVTSALGYVIAGTDLRWEDGAWYCFEANPSPSFTYYEQRTGQPIAAAVADLLAGALR